MAGRRARTSFAAIDFETADHQRDSACSVAVVRIENGRIVDQLHTLLRPPRKEFVFTYLHGITWAMVRRAPTFGDAWPNLLKLLTGVELVAAHNASFDRGVLRSCAERAGLIIPDLRFECTVRLAREVLGIYPATLENVCRKLRIPLNKHHDALCDASASARIVLAARECQLKRASAPFMQKRGG